MKKNRKLIISIAITAVIVCIITIMIIIFSKIYQKNINTKNEFTSARQAIEYMECRYIGKADSNELSYDTIYNVIFKVPLYDGDTSYESFYNNLIGYVASAEKYRNFVLRDKEKKIEIKVICDEGNSAISKIVINGNSNYFSTTDSKLSLENVTKINNTKINIQSNIINKLISFEWETTKVPFGTKESTFDGYDIYLEEGIEVKSVQNKVFNIVFGLNYKQNVINDIKVAESFDKIKTKLGEPNFSDDLMIGYKSDKIYIFFSQKQISIYRIDNYNTDQFASLISQFLAEKKSSNLVSALKEIWKDYDVYETSPYGVNLVYSLKGVNIQFNYSSEHGIHIYNNFKGKITNEMTLDDLTTSNKSTVLPDNIYFENKDLVVQSEYKRLHSIHNIDFFYPQYKSLLLNMNNGKKEDILVAQESNVFIVYKIENSFVMPNLKVLSKDGKNANSEISKNVTSTLWLNDSILAYSVKDEGIYLYDAIKRTEKNVITGKGGFTLKSFVQGSLKYDDKEMVIDL